MNFFLLYLLFLKATLSAFSGIAALPILREDFVVARHAVTDRDLNTAIVIGRATPGPQGLYIVSLGYYVGGFKGAAAASLALMTPAFLVIPLLEFAGRKADHPKVKQMLRTVVLASAGISLSATLHLASDAISGPFSAAITLGTLILLLKTDIDTIWAILGAAALAVLASAAGIAFR